MGEISLLRNVIIGAVPPPWVGGDTFEILQPRFWLMGGAKKTATKILAHGGGMKKIDLAPPIVGGEKVCPPPSWGGTEKCWIFVPPHDGGGQNVTRVTCNPPKVKKVHK